MSAYMTKQRKALLEFFEIHPDQVFSAQQITQYLEERSISVSAVYRNLTLLEDEGLLRRHVKAGTREVYYQYVASSHCRGRLHLACTRCEKLFHMSANHERQLVAQMSLLEGFHLNADMTVLYGVCPNCAKK
ncbi:MAG: transcriptional repressor [Eubacteriales bacterium]